MRRIIPMALALALAACTGSSSTNPTSGVSGSVHAIAQKPTPPTALRASQPSVWKDEPSSWFVTLTWQASPDADHYAVSRSGRALSSSVVGDGFEDAKPEPNTRYRYRVVAVGSDGATSRPASVTIETNAPPLQDARLSGSFVTKLHITSQSGLRSGASGDDRLFRFAPHCMTGPCAVTWSEKGLPGSGNLRPTSGGYAGTVFAPFGIGSCSGGRVVETLAFQIRIKRAQIARGQWSAAAFTGSLRERAPVSGCVTGRIDYRVRGLLRHAG